MKKLLVLLLACAGFYGHAQTISQPINPIVQDQGFIQLTGVEPDAYTPELARIQSHLCYVEGLLRQQDVSHLNPAQQYKRSVALDLLHTYWTAGVFPVNYDYPGERKPCFIDRDGNICAVGYLVQETAGREVAEQINTQHQYDYIMDMHEPVVNAWAGENGFTLEECAMIQPSYGGDLTPVYREAPLKKEYGITSGVLGGANLALSFMNMSGRYKGSKEVAIIGLMAGAANIIIGADKIRKDKEELTINGPKIITSYKPQNNLSYINIAMGTTTILTSAFNLLVNRKERKSSIGLYSYPGVNNNLNMGLSFSKRI
jgi:hypothetical protein